MFIVFGRKIPWFDGMAPPPPPSASDRQGQGQGSGQGQGQGPERASRDDGRSLAAGDDRGSIDESSSNNNSNSNRNSNGKSVRDEEFDSLVQLQRRYSPEVSNEVRVRSSE